MARDFEAGIAAHPEDWHMLQRVFAEDFDPARLPAAAEPGEELNAGVGGDGPGGGGPS
jgi:KDO2-lipid IV(A) lauroyltransferase